MIPSIFGVGAPKFVYGTTTVLLDYINVLTDEPDCKEIVHESIINFHREFVDIPDHYIFEVRWNLFKYPSVSDRKTKYNDLLQYEGLEVELWRRRDGDSLGMFVIDEITPKFVRTGDYPDYIIIKFVSSDPIETLNIVALPATGIDEDLFTANWSLWIGADGYKLDVSESSDFSTFVLEDEDVGDVLSYEVTGLEPSTIYYYRVRYYIDAVDSPNSNTIDLETLETSLPLIAQFNFEDWVMGGTGDAYVQTLVDSSGNGYDFITSTGNNIGTEADATLNNELIISFAAYGEYATRTYEDFFPEASFTMFFVVNQRSSGDSGAIMSLRHVTGGGDDAWFLLDLSGDNGGLRCSYRDDNGVSLNLGGSSEQNPLDADTWYIVCVQYNATTKTLRTIVNGNIESANNASHAPYDWSGVNVNRMLFNRTGNNGLVDFGNNFSNARMSDIRIYGLLSDGQINQVAALLKARHADIPTWADI